MRIDKPTCKYGEANCRKHFDGNCTVENDFELRCPIERTLNEVLKIINDEVILQKKMNEYRESGMDSRSPDAVDITKRLWKKVLAMKGDEQE